VRREISSSVLVGYTAGTLGRVSSPEVGLVLWRRLTRLNLQVTTASLRLWPPFTKVVQGPPDVAARLLLRDLSLVHWLLCTDIRKLGRLFAETAGCASVRIRLEHVADDACSRFHVDAVSLRLLCTYSGCGTEWLGEDGRVRCMDTMEVAVFKGSRFPVPGPRIQHRSPALHHLPSAERSRLVLCIDEAE
jgi:hypothetical protein